jgi:hypothetical protein
VIPALLNPTPRKAQEYDSLRTVTPFSTRKAHRT